MKRNLLVLGLIIVLASLATSISIAKKRPNISSPLAHEHLALPAPVLTEPCSEEFDLAGCPLAGCGELGDALLNTVKNRTTTATSPTTVTLDQMRALPQPDTWDTGSERSSITGPNREGTKIMVKGFLQKAKAEGAESCNCGLTRRVDTDIHLVIVSKMPDVEDPEAMDLSEQNSVTAEITPRVRKLGHPNWVYKNVNDLEGSYIRMKGWLMLDTKHIPQEHRLSHERSNHGLKRATNWEIHPVTALQVCTKSKSACDHGTGWVAF